MPSRLLPILLLQPLQFFEVVAVGGADFDRFADLICFSGFGGGQAGGDSVHTVDGDEVKNQPDQNTDEDITGKNQEQYIEALARAEAGILAEPQKAPDYNQGDRIWNHPNVEPRERVNHSGLW